MVEIKVKVKSVEDIKRIREEKYGVGPKYDKKDLPERLKKHVAEHEAIAAHYEEEEDDD